MEKQLHDLTIEEFTRLLLDYEKEYNLDLTTYDKDFKKKSHTLIGTYEQLLDTTAIHPKLYKQIENTLFDYELSLNQLDIYDYLDSKTKNFNTNRVKIVLDEMECFYHLTYLENKDAEAMNYYIENGLEIPYLPKKIFPKINNFQLIRNEFEIPDYDQMRREAFCECNFFYHRAIALLKSKVKKNKTSYNNSLSLTLPKELETPRAKELLNTAVKYNLLEEGCKWNTSLMTKRELAYLCYILSNKLELSSLRDNNNEGYFKTYWKPFKELFKNNNLNNNLRGITDEDELTETMERIKEIYSF